MSVTADVQPRFFGIYRGKVYDAADPTRKSRLRLIVPAVGGANDPLDWAMPCVPFGWDHGLMKPHADHTFSDDTGSGSTSKTLVHTNNHVLLTPLPKRGDRVWVMFEGGDARRPVWMGTWL